ncbi:hypothetical protein F4054_21690 [Candidatus Poribacteria bacterium]|nr:hypothetical protein [Candidatus Poribacteria bacterium]MYK24861.1 hypothetical protein [Candidatus Poribacteria bacterium]
MRSKKLLPFYVLITLLASGFIGFYIFWKTDPSNQRFAQPPEKLTPIAEFKHEALIYDVAFSPVNPSLIAGADADDTIKLWNRNNTEAPQVILSGHAKVTKSIAFSPIGEFIASGGLNGIVLWDVDSGQQISSLEIPVSEVAISPTGHQLATAGAHVQLWDIRNPKEITEIETLPHDESKSDHDTVWSVDFSPDGKWLAYGDENGKLEIWDVQHQKLARSVKADADDIRSVRFSADGDFLANIGFHNHTIWRLPEWQPHGKILGEALGLDIAFSPNNGTYVTSNLRGAVLRSTVNGERITSITGATDATWSVAFSADGRMLATGGDDETLRLWNVSTQQLARIDTSHRDIVRLIYFLSKDHPPRRGVSTKFDRLIKRAQRFYATQMNSHGFGRKTFTFETDERGRAKVYLLKAQHPDDYYREDTIKKIRTEITKHFDRSRNILLVAVGIRSGVFYEKDSTTSGVGGVTPFTYDSELNRALHGGSAFVSASDNDSDWGTIAHELGHTFGLKHDFRGRNPRIMSYASGRYELSKCAAEWLDKSRFFNPNQPFFDKPATIEMYPLQATSNSTLFQFDVTDEDGIHQVQLVAPTTPRDPVTKQGFKLHSCQSLDGQKNATVTFELNRTDVKEIRLSMMDLHGNIVWREFDFGDDTAQPSEKP